MLARIRKGEQTLRRKYQYRARSELINQSFPLLILCWFLCVSLSRVRPNKPRRKDAKKRGEEEKKDDNGGGDGGGGDGSGGNASGLKIDTYSYLFLRDIM